MLKEIIKKAGMVEYERVMRLIKSVNQIKKRPHPKENELIDMIINDLCYVNMDSGVLIGRSDIKYDYNCEKRKIALRDYLIHALVVKKVTDFDAVKN